MQPAVTLRSLPLQPITSENFRPYGQVIVPREDPCPYGPEDAQLQLHNGTPRVYIMRLLHRGRQFERITRHQKCTQCLGALGGKSWLLAVAPPTQEDYPDFNAIAAFQIPGNCLIKLDVGTWHAGPYFDDEAMEFYNLELSDTNLSDHETCNLLQSYRTRFFIGEMDD